MISTLRRVAAAVAVVGALLACAAFFRNETCSCSGGGLPLAAIALWSAVAAVGAFAVYLGLGTLASD